MRLWKLESLVEEAARVGMVNRPIIHICQKCNYRTPIPIKLSPLSVADSPKIDHAIAFEIKDGYCDKCNEEVWNKIAAQIEESINECIHCDGGRCKHYP